MKTKNTSYLTLILILVFFSTLLSAQENFSEKKVVVTIQGTDAQGARITKRIVMSTYAKGIVVIQVSQGEKVFSKQIFLN